MLVLSKEGEGRRKTEWRRKDKVIEEVRELNYLGIILTKSDSLKDMLKERPKKANVVMRQVWGIAEKKFKDDFRRRMMMIDSLVLGVMMYGVKLIGWRKSVEMERIQRKNQMVTRVDRCMSGYIVLAETNKEKSRIKAERRDMKFEEGIRTSTERLILKRCLKDKEKNIEERRHCKKKECLRSSGYSQQGIVRIRERAEV